jgi:hypothetical protein
MFRIIASILAVGGICWGAFLVAVISELAGPVAWWTYCVLLPGYLITMGYIVRAVSNPPLGLRRFIWGASAIVQGAWFLFAIVGAPIRTVGMCLLIGWWAGSFALSAYAVFADTKGRA